MSPRLSLEQRIRLKRATQSFANGGKRLRVRKARLPRQAQPDSVRASYFAALKGMVRRCRALVRERVLPILKEALKPTQSDSAQVLLDAAKDEHIARVRAAMRDVSRTIVGELSPGRIKRLAAKTARATSAKHQAELQRQIRSAVGVEVELAEPWLTPMVERFTADNAALIVDVPKVFMEQVEDISVRAIREGTRWEVLAKRIEERGVVGESRAKLIARDQVGKLFGALNEVRQTELGITHYIWRSVNDNRVRDTHHERDGERFAWDEPPGDLSDPGDGGHPGFPINCRCYPDPDMSELLASLTGEPIPPEPKEPEEPPEEAPPEPKETPPAPEPAASFAGPDGARYAAEFPELAETFGNKLHITDAPTTREHLEGLTKIPSVMLEKLAPLMNEVRIGKGLLDELGGPLSEQVGPQMALKALGVFEARSRSVLVGSLDPNGMKGVATHELGHAADAFLGPTRFADTREFQRIWQRAKGGGQIKNVYAKTNAREGFAEAFREILIDGEPAARVRFGSELTDMVSGFIKKHSEPKKKGGNS